MRLDSQPLVRITRSMLAVSLTQLLVVALVAISAGAQNISFQDVKRDFLVGTSPQVVRVADFNGDHISDLVTVNAGSADITVLLGKGDGTFGAPISSPVGQSPNGVAVADFNGDGKTDAAVVDPNTNVVWVLLGKGDGTFRATR